MKRLVASGLVELVVDAELEVVRPNVLVCLGAVAAQALLGSKVRVTKDRGKPLESELAPVVLVTIHTSAILRERDEPAREQAFAGFVEDLRVVQRLGTASPARERRHGMGHRSGG